jgi:LmbE family N-acetylglucosaminyl deacetylase
MKFKFNKVLVLAPHTDDGEIGCGGFISKIIREGGEVRYLAFSSAKKSLREQGKPEDLLITESQNATLRLGIPKKNLYVHDIDVREFDKYRQDILDILIRERAIYKPDLVLSPSLNDIHQDHAVVAQESLRAFKNISILGYEMPWNNIEFQTTVFVKLKPEDIENKVCALKCYASQSHRTYFDDVFIRSLAKVRGVQIQSEFAESYEVMRLVIN